MSDETIELLSCPFCGGKPQMTVREHGCWVYCPHCGASGDGSDVMYGAAAAWNRRHTDAAPGEAELYARLEELAKAIMRRPAPYSDELGRKHYELAHDTLKILRARALRESE